MPNRDSSPTLATPTGAPRPAPAELWHVRSAAEVARALGTGPDGLPTRIVEQRFQEMGPNEVEVERETPWWVLALGQLRDPLIYILLVAAGVTLALGDVTDAGVILVVVGLNGVIGFVQELRARRAMRALAQLSAPHAQVVRDGEAREVPSRELVPGDVVRLTSGSLVPADLRLVEARDLALDESLLTGESIVVEKTDAPLADPGLVAPDQRNMAFAGTTVVHGRGEGIVVRTGAATELGRIAYVMRGVGRSTTPLQETFARLGRWTGVVVLALLAALLLVATDADTHRLLPLFAIGVFIGFTLSQVGLVRHWTTSRPPGWKRRALINGTGALLTTLAGVILLLTKFLGGAWVVVLAVPLLMLLFARIQRYYTAVGRELGLGRIPQPPSRHTGSLVIVPIGEVSKLARHALGAALALGDEVVAVAVHADPVRSRALEEAWDRWNPGVRLDIVNSPHRSLVQPIVDYVRRAAEGGRQVAVLIPEVEPLHRRYEILQNQRGLLLATVLRARTDVVVCLLPYRLKL